jgi:hypothetical protein
VSKISPYPLSTVKTPNYFGREDLCSDSLVRWTTELALLVRISFLFIPLSSPPVHLSRSVASEPSFQVLATSLRTFLSASNRKTPVAF